MALPLFAFSQQDQRRIENDTAAHTLLEQVSKNYHDATTLKIEFSLQVEVPEEHEPVNSSGTVFLSDDKYKIETDEMIIICDNVKRYVYLKESNELQVNFFEPEEHEIESPSDLYDIYKKDYFYRIGGEITDGGKKLSVVQLIPADIKTSPYKIIFLYIDKENLEIKKAQINSKDGVKYTYTINSINENPLSNTEFVFDPSKYPGIYIDDMTK